MEKRSASPTKLPNLSHLEWAVESRARNQRSAVRLLRLFTEHEALWKTQRWSRAAQDLLSVSFSLWRAAFLADKSGQRKAVFADGRDFLEKIIEDNAISYPQDRKCREWTFNYYTRNARAALQVLAEYWPEQVPEYLGMKLSATKRWEYCQNLLDKAIAGFEVATRNQKAREEKSKKTHETKGAAKLKKKISRAFTLAQRSST
ncbi:MAG: hypothetical protein QM808_05870 [Steroidobacteraceae bacterium]